MRAQTNNNNYITVMGIDPGIAVTGFGIIRGRGSQIQPVHSGTIRTNSTECVAARLKHIFINLKDIMNTYQPEEVAVEEVFFSRNVSSAMKLGQARGVALMTAFTCGAELGEYSALEVKKAVVGFGRATKEQVQLMVQRLLALSRKPEPNDVADALAIAICHFHTLQSRWPAETLRGRTRRK
ncbi:crossover junction endodeoxyribonuclease RuvC [candidate division CSSED10-310 bacterium]|uniref:Crossover junction endodeoxyribonuclease RuvC n=1 Tax=candidate division CSSED10-310 bacterium TaxID=2855610 RepID=A0ABV6Z0E0_UNCC1